MEEIRATNFGVAGGQRSEMEMALKIEKPSLNLIFMICWDAKMATQVLHKKVGSASIKAREGCLSVLGNKYFRAPDEE